MLYYVTVLTVLIQLGATMRLTEGSRELINIDYRSRVPIYDQIVNGFIKLRAVGVLKADDKLPSVRALATDLHINPNTVQRAYNALETEGIIYSVSGKGSFISGDSAADEALKSAAREDFKKAVKEAVLRGIDTAELIKIIEEGEYGA